MKRRSLLRACGFGVAVGLAGCGSRAIDLADEVEESDGTTQEGGGNGERTTEREQATTDESTPERNDRETPADVDQQTTDDAEQTTEAANQQTTENADQQTTTTSESPRLTSTGMSAGKGSCGSGSSTTVTFDDSAGEVVVEGSIPAPNPCHRPVLDGASYDPDADSLTITVGLAEPDDSVVCVQCIGSLPYTARAGFDGGLPESVTIVHDGIERRTAARATNA